MNYPTHTQLSLLNCNLNCFDLTSGGGVSWCGPYKSLSVRFAGEFRPPV